MVYFVYKLNKLNVNIFDHAERDVFAVFAHLICFKQHRKNRGIVVVNEQILTQTHFRLQMQTKMAAVAAL